MAQVEWPKLDDRLYWIPCGFTVCDKHTNMHASKHLVLLIMFNASLVSAQGSKDVETNLEPFTIHTGYMSLLGYLRYQNYLETGRWRSIKEFHLGYRDTHIKRSKSAITIDFGNLGQIGDFDSMNSYGISLMSKVVPIFPRLDKYSVLWSYFFSVGEGEHTSIYEYYVIYDRKNKTFEDITGKKFNVTDANVLAMSEKTTNLLCKN